MEYMRTLPDNAFDLAICDPPYGGGNDGELNGGGEGSGEDSTDTSQPRFRRQVREVQLPPPRRKKGEPNIVGHRTIRRLLQ